MVYEIHRSWEQQLAAATYSASVVDWATLDCLWDDQETKKSASEYPDRLSVEEAENQRPKSGEYCKYLKIRLMACRCEVLREA